MTKNETDWVWPDTIPGYDPVKCKREAHARIQRETAGMTDAEVREYFRRGEERFDAETKRRRMEHAEAGK